MIKAVIFDMDGLLVNTEPLWRQAEIAAFREVDMELTEDDCKLTMGMRTNEVMDFWWDRSPWNGLSKEELEALLLDNIAELMASVAQPLRGVQEVVNYFTEKELPMALASSSPMRLIRICVAKLRLEDELKIMHSAEFEQFGKPHPAVYLSTATQLGVDPNECVAFEDSVFGLQAALAAGMKCVAVPAAEDAHLEGFRQANLVLDSLDAFTDHHFEELNN